MASTVAAFPLPHGAAISYGIASTAVTGSVSARHLFRQADAAQYKAKRARARALRATVPATADPNVTAERVLVAGSSAIAAAQSGVVPAPVRVRRGRDRDARRFHLDRPDPPRGRVADEPAAAVARGGSPAEVGAQFATVVVGYGPWLVEIGMSATAATGDVVLTSLDALAGVAVRGAR